MEFLLVDRPKTRAEHYTIVPSDSWLMMGIKELWDFEEMQNPLYADFVFSDAAKMIDQLYKVTDAPYPDYAGAFYYQYGDYPYADGARCEGLLGAYELAVKMGEREIARQIWRAVRLAAWALMHLVNTKEAVYFARNPELASVASDSNTPGNGSASTPSSTSPRSMPSCCRTGIAPKPNQ